MSKPCKEDHKPSKPMSGCEGSPRRVRFPCSTEGLANWAGTARSQNRAGSTQQPHEKRATCWRKAIRRPGIVYLVQQGESANHKIGFTRSTKVAARVSSLQVGCGDRLALVGQFAVDDGIAELDLHDIFASKHLHGEWFRLTPGDVAEILSLEWRVKNLIGLAERKRPIAFGRSDAELEAYWAAREREIALAQRHLALIMAGLESEAA